MSEENVELARQSMEALERRDRTAWLALHDEDYEVVPIRDWPEAGGRGREDAWDGIIEMLDTFQRVPVDNVEVVDAGADKVLVQQRVDLRGAGSGAGVEYASWAVVTIRQGLILRTEFFADRDEALEAAGLSE